MGIYDRDYYREEPRGGFANFQPWSVTTWLIIINVAVFFLDGLLGRLFTQNPFESPVGPFTALGYFSIDTAIRHLEIWRFITFQFLHANLMHLLYNMIGLYMFGPIVEAHLGPRRYLGFYLSCGIAGASMFVFLWAAGFFTMSIATILVGASAGIFGILLAAAKITPRMTITLLFPPIPIEIRYLAWGYFGLAVYTVIRLGPNAGGEAAHIGGAILGLVLIYNEHWLNFLVPAVKRGKTRRKVAFKDWSRDSNH